MRSNDNSKLMSLRQYANDALRQMPIGYRMESIPHCTGHLTLEMNRMSINFNTEKVEFHDEITVKFGYPSEEKPKWRLMPYKPSEFPKNWEDGSWCIVATNGQEVRKASCLKEAIQHFIELFVDKVHQDCPNNLPRLTGRIIEDVDFHKGWMPLSQDYRDDPRAQIAI